MDYECQDHFVGLALRGLIIVFLKPKNKMKLRMLLSSLFQSHITFGKNELLKATALVFGGGVLKAERVWILSIR